MDRNKYVAISLLDLSKAFDSINQDHLKNKLYDIGFTKSAIELIHSFKDNKQQKTVVKKTEFNWISLQQGVPQRTILVPLIFNLYINDSNNS